MLKGKMIIPIIRLIKKLTTKDDLKRFAQMFKTDTTDKTPEEIERLTEEKGLEVVYFIIEKLSDAEKEVFDVIATYKSIKPAEAMELGIDEIINIFKEIVTEGDFQKVFTLAVK